jgi:Skp family chaperone for outer membrane proteins
MRKQIINFFVVAALCACPVLASAYEFGVVDTSQIFSKYKETQKTKETLETKKTELQKDLENRKEDVKKIDDEYVSVAKQLQDLRDSKKDKEAKTLETKLADLRKSLAQKSGDLQKFFEESD